MPEAEYARDGARRQSASAQRAAAGVHALQVARATPNLPFSRRKRYFRVQSTEPGYTHKMPRPLFSHSSENRFTAATPHVPRKPVSVPNLQMSKTKAEGAQTQSPPTTHLLTPAPLHQCRNSSRCVCAVERARKVRRLPRRARQRGSNRRPARQTVHRVVQHAEWNRTRRNQRNSKPGTSKMVRKLSESFFPVGLQVWRRFEERTGTAGAEQKKGENNAQQSETTRCCRRWLWCHAPKAKSPPAMARTSTQRNEPATRPRMPSRAKMSPAQMPGIKRDQEKCSQRVLSPCNRRSG